MTNLQQLQESAQKKFKEQFIEYRSDYSAHFIEYKHRELGEKSAAEDAMDFLDQLIASTIEEVRKAVVPELKEIPLQQYDYDEIPDEKLAEININRQLLGENLAAIEIRRRFTELTSEQKEI